VSSIVATLSAAASYFLVIVGFQLFEHLIPAERSQPLCNLSFSAICTLGLLLLNPLAAAATLWATGFLRPSIITIDLSAWITGYPIIDWPLSNFLLPFIPLLIFDFFYYWHHRFQHMIPAFWEQHKLHHTEESLNSLTNLRHHWLEDFIRIVTISIPMGLLVRITPVQGALVATALTHWSVFFHANLRLPFGPFTAVVCGPQYHRIHHSRLADHQNRNFAAFFPIWDILFSTYYRPRAGEWPATGLYSGEKITSLTEAVVGPFRAWSRMIRVKNTAAPAVRREVEEKWR
jgi:sterol desaturase/sphingolipid hydroxylase (fatty acid hydroxylase superfamily)